MSRFYCGGMRCPGLGQVATVNNPHPPSCLCRFDTWPGLAAASMGHVAPEDRDPSAQARDVDPDQLACQQRVARLAFDLEGKYQPWGVTGLYAAGLYAALTSLARRSPELAEVARDEAEEWATTLWEHVGPGDPVDQRPQKPRPDLRRRNRSQRVARTPTAHEHCTACCLATACQQPSRLPGRTIAELAELAVELLMQIPVGHNLSGEPVPLMSHGPVILAPAYVERFQELVVDLRRLQFADGLERARWIHRETP